MPKYETVIYEVDGHVATLTLKPPRADERHEPDAQGRAAGRVAGGEGDPDVWCAILTGAGKGFSTGADVEGLATGGFTKPDRWRELALIEGIVELPTPRRQRVSSR